MAIKLNGVEITSNKLNNSNVTLENLNGVKVFPTAVPATGWSLVGESNDYIASFEQTNFLIDPNTIGCGYSITHLPSASLYLVGDIVRGRMNPISGNPCNTWVYYEAVIDEAVIENKWQFVGSYSSEPYNYDVLTSSQYLYSDYEEGINYLNINYPAGDYDEGFVVIIPDFISQDFFEFIVVSI